MSRKKLKRVLAAVMVFYVFTAVLALFLLDGKESYFELRGKKDAAVEKTAEKDYIDIIEADTEDVQHRLGETGTERGDVPAPDAVTEGKAAPILDLPTEARSETKADPGTKGSETVTESTTETVAVPVEPGPEKVTEAITEKNTREKITEGNTREKDTEAVTEKNTREKGTEEKTSEDPSGKTVVQMPAAGPYYSFVTTNQGTTLRIREEANGKAKTVVALYPGSVGCVLEKGEEWSKVLYKGKSGYCYNRFLKLQEIKKEEYKTLFDKNAQ